MTRFYGTSGCTKPLVSDLQALGLSNIETFAHVESLFDRIDFTIAERRAYEEQLHRAALEAARLEASSLESLLDVRVSEREAQLAYERDSLPGMIETLAAEVCSHPLKGMPHVPRWLKLRLRHRTLLRHLEREARRPLRRDRAEADCLRARATTLEQNMLASIDARLAPYVEAKRYLEANRNTFFGAKGEERIIEALAALPDDFVVISDVFVDLGRSARWQQRSGVRVRRAQIDHVVVGPGCVFLLETKNWTRVTLDSAAESPYEQISRAQYIFHVLAYQRFHRRKMHRRNIVVLLSDRSNRARRLAPPYNYVHQVPLSELAGFIKSQHPYHEPGAVTAPETLDWLLGR